MQRRNAVLSRKLLFGLLLETLFEFCDASTGIKDALLSGIERMADRADFNEERTALDCGTCCESLAATAGHSCRSVVRMDILFHDLLLLISSPLGPDSR